MPEEKFEKIIQVTEAESKLKRVETSMKYTLGYWYETMQWLKYQGKLMRYSAEGHISHIYAQRMPHSITYPEVKILGLL